MNAQGVSINGPRSAQAADAPTRRLQLSLLQQAWLTEIGLERRMLVPYIPAPSGAGPALPTRSDAQRIHTSALSQPDAQHHDAPSRSQSGTFVSGPDLALAALKQVGGQRRAVPPPTTVQGEMRPKLEHPVGRPSTRPQDLPTEWTALQAHADACQACNLHSQRDQLVFGAGDTQQPDWLIVGEAPGKSDDRTGQPFQGKAGKLLHAMLVAAGVHPGSVALGGQPQLTPAWSQPSSMYFANLIKCRPLGNRSPDAAEVAACMPYLTQQIELLQPQRILALGRLAAQAILGVNHEVEDLRGRLHYVTAAAGVQIPVVVTWHPAALLMHPQNKGAAWADLNLAKGV